MDFELDGIDEKDLGGHGFPTIKVIEWKLEAKVAASPLILCNAKGATLYEMQPEDVEVKSLRRRPGISATCYILWDGFGSTPGELAITRTAHPAVLDAAIKRFEAHLAERFEQQRISFIQELIDEGTHPYKQPPKTKVEAAERDLFDVLAITAQPALKGTREQRKLSTQLLRLAIEERSDALDRILADVLDLDDELRNELSELLSRSSLPGIIGAVNEVARRSDLLIALRRLLYGKDDKEKVTEIRHLHPLIADNIWVFGEHWRLAQSEAGLTTVIRDVIGDNALLEADLLNQPVVKSDGRKGRVDLVLHRDLSEPDGFRRLVVELKRPTTVLRAKHLDQVKKYARALSTHQAIPTEHWEFWLVGSSTHEEIEDEIAQQERPRGHAIKNDRYNLHVVTWGEIINARSHALKWIDNQLNDAVTGDDDALRRVRARYANLIPLPAASPDEAA